MKKRWLFLFALALALALPARALAQNLWGGAGAKPSLVTDKANLLSADEEALLAEHAAKIEETYAIEAVILTVDGTGGKSVVAFADDYYDNNGFGVGASKDGLLFLLSMEERDWYISTCGKAISIFTDYGIQRIGDHVVDDLSNGDYYKAFELFLFDVERFAAEYESGQAFDVNHKVTLTDPLADAIETLPLIALVALIVSLVTVFVMKGKLKTARRKPAADEYVSEGSFALTGAHDLYLYTTTTRVKIESESSGGGSSTHSSSSGTSHGGGGGKF